MAAIDARLLAKNVKYTHRTSKFGSYTFSRWEKVG
jgi:hypothetical protein